MKCLANWPKPMRMINGEDSSLPNYPGFIRDVFDVVKDYFLGLGAPLIPFDLFDMFESAYVKAESVKARHVVTILKETRYVMRKFEPVIRLVLCNFGADCRLVIN